MGKSISVCKGRGSVAHNNREFVTENVDVTKIKDNITYKQEPLELAYEKCFGQAIEEYNEKQSRADRRIDGARGYMEQIRTSKNGEKLFYETVVQVGNMQDSHIDTTDGQTCKKILDEYMRDFQKDNPNLYVFNAVLHADEQTHHLHIDWIPLAHGYQKGLQCRNSLDRALKEQGIGGKANKHDNSTLRWQNAQKDRIEIIMREYGIEREEEKGLGRKHQTVDQYKAQTEIIANEVAQLPAQIESKPIRFDKDRVSVKKEDLERLEQRAKLSIVQEKTVKKAVEEVKKDQKSTEHYVLRKMAMASNTLDSAEAEYSKARKEREDAEREKAKWQKQYKLQKDLNENYKVLRADWENQREIVGVLQNENTSLKAENDDLRRSTEESIEKATEPLKTKIDVLERQNKGLKSRLADVCEHFASVVKAFNMLKYDKEDGYQIFNLSGKQSRLFDAIEKFATGILREHGAESDARDIEKNIGISKDIRNEIKELEPKDRGGRY